jgi:eukaryotic-like serine/threonine-protein kinase
VAATAHDPDERPDDGVDFARALARAVPDGASPLDLDELVRDTIVVPLDLEEDADGPPPHPARSTRSIPPDGTTTVVRGTPDAAASPAVGGDHHGISTHGAPDDGPDGWADGGVDDEDAGYEDDDGWDRPPRRRRRWLLATLIVLGLLAASAAGGYLLWDRVLAPVTPIPAVVGAASDVAVDRLEEAGFVVRVANERPHHLEVPADHVLDQSPTGEARRGASIVLTVSAGPRQVEVPDVVGEPAEEATAAVSEAGLVPVTSEEYDEEVPAGIVLSADPRPGEVLDETSEVALVISRGPRPIEVADVRGRSLDEATTVLREAGLELEVVDRRYDDATAAGTVLSQDPAPGSVLRRGDTVQVTVSRGPEPIAVPNLRGMRTGEAIAELEALGFEVQVERRAGSARSSTPTGSSTRIPHPTPTVGAGTPSPSTRTTTEAVRARPQAPGPVAGRASARCPATPTSCASAGHPSNARSEIARSA